MPAQVQVVAAGKLGAVAVVQAMTDLQVTAQVGRVDLGLAAQAVSLEDHDG